jgi:ParB family chromosome partitioning protein
MKAPIQSGAASSSNQNAGAAIGSIVRIPIDLIVVNPKQPRRDFDEQALKELSESIALHDIIQPITVVKLSPTN